MLATSRPALDPPPYEETTPLLTAAQRAQLLPMAGRTPPASPSVRPRKTLSLREAVHPDAGATWLLREINPTTRTPPSACATAIV